MKVKEFIKKLQEYDEDMEVVVYDSYEDGYNKAEGLNLVKGIKDTRKYMMCDYMKYKDVYDSECEKKTLLEISMYQE